MAYKKSIEVEIKGLFDSAPKGTSTHYLEHFDQNDVADTVNRLAREFPKDIQDTQVFYGNKAPIYIMK